MCIHKRHSCRNFANWLDMLNDGTKMHKKMWLEFNALLGILHRSICLRYADIYYISIIFILNYVKYCLNSKDTKCIWNNFLVQGWNDRIQLSAIKYFSLLLVFSLTRDMKMVTAPKGMYCMIVQQLDQELELLVNTCNLRNVVSM